MKIIIFVVLRLGVKIRSILIEYYTLNLYTWSSLNSLYIVQYYHMNIKFHKLSSCVSMMSIIVFA